MKQSKSSILLTVVSLLLSLTVFFPSGTDQPIGMFTGRLTVLPRNLRCLYFLASFF